MITTTMRMVDGIHCHTTSTRPAANSKSVMRCRKIVKKSNALVALGLELVICSSSFQQRLVNTSTTSNNSNCSTSVRADGLLCTTGQPDTSLVLLRCMSDDGSVVSRCSSERSTVADLLLDVADDGTFGHTSEWQHVTNGERRFFTAVYKCSSV